MKRALPLFLVAIAACSSAASSGPSSDAAEATPPANANPGESQASKDIPKDPTTQIAVGVDAEDFSGAGFALDRIVVEATVDGTLAASASVFGSLPSEVRLVAPKEHPDAPVTITVTAKMHDEVVVSRRATTRFVPGKALLAYLKLEVRCNSFPLLGGGISGPTCDPSLTCVGGVCRSDELPPLPDYRADWKTSPPSACGDGPTATLEIGQGEKTRAPLADGDTVTVECGPQGGHHLWLSLGMKDLAQYGTVTTLAAAQPGGGASVPATAYPYALSAGEGGACELGGLRFQLDLGGHAIDEFLGKPLDIEVKAKDKAGREASATRHVQVAKERAGNFCR